MSFHILQINDFTECNYWRSPYEHLYNIYTKIMDAEVKALEMFRFSYTALNRGKFDFEYLTHIPILGSYCILPPKFFIIF